MSDARTPSAGPVQPLTAIDVAYPQPGDVMAVVDGQALVFAEDSSGRRIPLATIGSGGGIVGCAADADGTRLLVTGLPGTTVSRTTIEAEPAPDLLLGWVLTVSDAVSDGRWPGRLIPIADAGSILAPGEHVGGSHDLAWVTVTRGEAMLCGSATARVARTDPPLPLAPTAWLTAGLRCRVQAAQPPADPADWSRRLDLLGRLALSAATGLRRDRDAATVDRLEERRLRADAAAEDAVDTVTAAIGGAQRLPRLHDERRSAELAAATEVARAAGLSVAEDQLARVARDVETGRDPLVAVAAACGARARSITLEAGWWQREGSPLLVSVAGDRAGESVPAAAVWRRGWVLVPGAGGPAQRVDAELAARVDRRATELLPILPQRPESLAGLGRLALRGSAREIAIVLAVTVLLAALSFVTPFLLGQLASLFVGSATASAYAGLFGAMVLVVIAGTAWQSVRALAMLRARSQAAAIASGAVWERVMRQRARWHTDQSLGDRSAQAQAVNSASAALPDETLARLLDAATVLGSLAAIATTNGTLLAAVALLLVVQALATALLLRSAARRAGQRVAAAAVATGRLMEILRAVNRLRVAGAESRAFLRWAQAQAPFSRADQALRRITMAQGVVIAVWPAVSLMVVVAVTSATGAGFGEFVTAQTATAAASTAVAAMALSANGALVARQALRKATPALETVPEGGSDGVQPGPLSGGMEVRDLVFRYGPDLPAALDRVSLRVRPGEHVAVVGPSGCGKTTLMRVLLGLEDPESGVIAVDGRDLASLDRPAVRRQIGSVLQSSTLLPGTIKDNVAMGRTLPRDDIWAALDAAAVGADIREMAMGLDTPVTDGGGTLSGGQRQRVLIARALAGNPRMLILDEATSALDNLTQAAVVEALEGLRITRIVVAHRLSTIRSADRVIVMQDGRIVDEGTYADLVARPGVFRDLAERQQA